MLKIDETLLLIIDVQEKLFRVIPEKETLSGNLQKLIRGCGLLSVPAIITEQNPAGLGPTIAEVTTLLPDSTKLSKFCFNCCAEVTFMEELAATGRHQVLVCGIESHICVYQTTLDLLAHGYEVHLVTDCVASRAMDNKKLAVKRLQCEGAKLTGVEMAIFELLRTAKAEQFRAVSTLIK
ncbi:hydrolase [Dehalogenimonas sp. THU2]|uniref:hydrolase n=1 Tax=Dehalogenimonas sp. THU2 TaxID=3151121 RepID=UPI003218DAB2